MGTVKDFVTGNTHAVMWVVAFGGVCVLVGLGKLDPKVIEFLVMSLGGAVAASNGAPKAGQPNVPTPGQ